MKKRILLAFAGQMYTGKDTSANIWIKHHSAFKYSRIAFANGIKDICKSMLGLSDADVNTPDGKKRFVPEYGKTVREILQGVGEGMRSYVSRDIWVHVTMLKIQKVLELNDTSILVTDVRYPNELKALRNAGFTLIKLKRNTGVIDKHPSEQDLRDELFDYIVDNNGSLEELEEKLLLLPEYAV